MARRKKEKPDNKDSDNLSLAAPDAGNGNRITFHFIKSSYFRTIHADGCIGGPSPNGRHITMAFFSERHAIPLQVVQEIRADGRLGEEIRRDGREGVVRELEVEIAMDVQSAAVIAEWLNRHLATVQRESERSSGE